MLAASELIEPEYLLPGPVSAGPRLQLPQAITALGSVDLEWMKRCLS